MQVTSLLSQAGPDLPASESPPRLRLAMAVFGGVLLLNSYLAEWLLGVSPAVASASALAGALLPADGVIRSGQAALNEASVTGESLPVDKGDGDPGFAGKGSVPES